MSGAYGREPDGRAMSAAERHAVHLDQVAAERDKPWRCDDCGVPEALLERGLFRMPGFRDVDYCGGFIQPDAWYCELCFWRARDEYTTWVDTRPDQDVQIASLPAVIACQPLTCQPCSGRDPV